MRIVVLLARAGIASRRKAADLIKAGRVRVDGVVVREAGAKADPARQRITFNNRPLPAPEQLRTIMMNKPVGLLCSASNSQGHTVVDLVNHLPERLLPVGRLDRDSGGLLLLSNDGDLIHRLTHARFGHSKLYHVEVSGRCNSAALAKLRAPMEIDGYTIRPVAVGVLRKHEGKTWLSFELKEGRNRQIRNMCEQAGLRVVSLTRMAIDEIKLPESLAPGEWRDLTATELKALG